MVATDLLQHQQKQFNFKKHGCVTLGFTYCDVTELLVEFFVHIGLENIKYYLQFLTWLSKSGLPSK